jgi:hypothetical protein
MKKLRSLVLTMGVILFILGFSIAPFAVHLTETYVNREVVALSTLDSMAPNLSLGFLFAFCSLNAGVMLWAYTRTGLSHPPNLVFILGLLISLTSAFLSIWLYLRQLRFFESQFDTYGNIALATSAINYFSWGFPFVFLVSGMIIMFLLWFPYLKENQISLVSIGQNVHTRYLGIATVVFLVFALISFTSFLCRLFPAVIRTN